MFPGGNNITTGYGNILLGYNVVGTTTTSHSFINIGNAIFGYMPATTTSTTLPSTPVGVAFGIATSTFVNNTFVLQNACRQLQLENRPEEA